MRNLILASTSTLHGSGFLEYLSMELKNLFNGTKEILFIPFARPGGASHDSYTAMVRKELEPLGFEINGLHEYSDMKKAIIDAEAIFVGGGNTFVLLQTLYKHNIIDILRTVIINGTPYLGTSAGSNICGLTINTTNDMPIVYPQSFKAMGIVPFNINPHYLDPDENSSHMGETREMRIKEYHAYNSPPVIGLREGSWIEVKGKSVTLKGKLTAKIFSQEAEPFEKESGSDLSLLK